MQAKDIQESLKTMVDLTDLYLASSFHEAVKNKDRIPTSANNLCKSSVMRVDGFAVVEMISAIDQAKAELERSKSWILNNWQNALDDQKEEDL